MSYFLSVKHTRTIASAGASLNDALRTATIGPQFSGDLFLVVTLQYNNRHTSARAQKFFSHT